jgi:hypothetical protein|tara:strand:+ start:192 stop:410 length:219 start_codon:yes stop_codon:yes gene_type:complete
MTKEVEALDTLDEYSDDQYSAFLEYTALKDQCIIEPTTLYIDKSHEFLSEWTYFAQVDGLDLRIIDGETKIC